MFGIKAGKETVAVKPSAIVLPSKEEIKDYNQKCDDSKKDIQDIPNYEVREMFISYGNIVRDTISELRQAIFEKVAKIESNIKTIADVMYNNSVVLDDIKTRVYAPPVMHPETALLRSEAKERIAFLEKMVVNLTERAMAQPVTLPVPEPKIIKEEVLVEVEKPFDVDKLTEDQLKKCVEELPSEDVFDLIDLEDLSDAQLEKAARLLPVDKLLKLAREKKSS